MLAQLKAKARQLKSQIGFLYYAAQDKRIGIIPKAVIAVTLLYALSPIDLIPDFIPLLGYLDDLIIIPLLITIAIKMIPRDITAELKAKAACEPVQLKKNWTFGILFILFWLVVLALVIKSIIKLFVKS